MALGDDNMAIWTVTNFDGSRATIETSKLLKILEDEYQSQDVGWKINKDKTYV